MLLDELGLVVKHVQARRRHNAKLKAQRLNDKTGAHLANKDDDEGFDDTRKPAESWELLSKSTFERFNEVRFRATMPRV